MGVIATVTIGADDFSVYALTATVLTDANTFFNGMLGAHAAAWNAATDDNKKRALVMAADWMDRAVGDFLSGEETTDGQPREWPRDGASCNGTAVPDGTVPDAVARAEFWLAGYLLVDSTLASGTGTGSNVKQAKAGSASVTFFSATLGTGGISDTRLPIPAMDLLKCFFSGAGSIGTGVASGVDGSSAFDDCDYKRTEGYA